MCAFNIESQKVVDLSTSCSLAMGDVTGVVPPLALVRSDDGMVVVVVFAFVSSTPDCDIPPLDSGGVGSCTCTCTLLIAFIGSCCRMV